jgi:hypothetical protein
MFGILNEVIGRAMKFLSVWYISAYFCGLIVVTGPRKVQLPKKLRIPS